MGYIFHLMGKSSSGKDTIYRELVKLEKDRLAPIVMYTTRPIRSGEMDHREYHFVDLDCYETMLREGRVIEERVYHTVHGDWHYFTADDGQIDLDEKNYLMIGTLESFLKLRDYYGEASVLPLYVEVEDKERLLRAIERESRQETPSYPEVCRRFLADDADFSEEKLAHAGITKRFENRDLAACLEEMRLYISGKI